MEFGLGFTPHKFVLAPGQFRSVRMIPTQYPKHKDYVYLLDIHDQGKDSWHPVMSKQKAVSHVSVTETLGVRLLVRPANARAVITMKRQGQQVTFTNKGNTDAYVKLHCPSSSPDCVTPETMSRVYAGTTWSVKLGKTAPVSYEVEYPGFHSSYKLS